MAARAVAISVVRRCRLTVTATATKWVEVTRPIRLASHGGQCCAPHRAYSRCTAAARGSGADVMERVIEAAEPAKISQFRSHKGATCSLRSSRQQMHVVLTFLYVHENPSTKQLD
eukprot:TRINITY_DN2473_c0_g3_i1.p1 TRINITY_DN2473_c0_g3~~TRINITY_DN2473_c0_g3_i1.p1  ORF type:complete len:115 (-),score=4.37 TRINITY_DN2473_c0_g3_i1:176-520(-)